ncbi:MAG: carbohydrate porin [Prevotellaceae bacterium]|jgi:porin|nr:carbohydrate porin [Prevotellaceae bacterium]
MKKNIYTMLVLAFLEAGTNAQDIEKRKADYFSFGASYVGDVVGNFSGGIKTGATCLGMAAITVGFDTEKANWWKGGELFVKGGNTHGGEPSATLIGDFQKVSNIEAGNHTYLYELWYRQRFGRLSFTAGLQDLNADYAASEGGALFNNSYFGIHSVCADNVPAPIFPMTGLALNIAWDIAKSYRWQVAVWDAYLYCWEENPYNLRWNLSAKEGLLAITEFQVANSLIKGHAGEYKIGGYYYHSSIDPEMPDNNFGFYFVGDQEITDKFALFAQIGFSPEKYNSHTQCYGLGMTVRNFSSQRPDDKIGLAANYAVFTDNEAGNEAVIELQYHLQLNGNIYLKPDIQYIINPAGSDEKLKNALVAMLRFGVEF